MQNQPLTDQSLKQLRIIFFALLMGQFSICGVFVYLNMELGPVLGEYDEVLFYVPLLLSFSMATGSGFVRTSLLSKVGGQSSLAGKFGLYRSSTIVGWAMLEGAAFINLIFYYLIGAWILMALFVGSLALFFRYYPTVGGIVRDLHLSSKETKELEQLFGEQG